MTRLFAFPRPEQYPLGSTLSCLSLARHDPSSLTLPNGGRRKLYWSGDSLCRLTVGANQTEIRVEVEGEQSEEASLRALLGLHDRPQMELHPDDPLLRLPRKVRELRLGRVFWPFEAVFQTILHQRVSGSEASLNWRRLCRRFGERWDGLVSGPSPRTVLALSPAQFASCGVEQKRMIPIKEAASRLRDTRAREMSLDQLEQVLLRLPGIGPWTAAYTRGHFLGDPDAIPLGDYELPHWVCYFFRRQRRGTDREMLELLAPYAGQRQRVLRWLIAAGAVPPRRGARLPHGTLTARG